MQTNIFGEPHSNGLTIEQAAYKANVSTATIRNWIKTGYLEQAGKGLITKQSLENFMCNVAGKEKLNARANKHLKDSHQHELLQNVVEKLAQEHEGEQIGIAYEKKLSESYKNQEGIYYTPSWIVKDMLANIKIEPHYTFLDPCCGSGNFILEALRLGIAVENIYGFDTDENAVFITKERIRQEFGVEASNIVVGDFLENASAFYDKNMSFNLIFTNPPWGKKIDKSAKEKYAQMYETHKSVDTTSLFMGACLKIISPNGLLGFLIQDAFFNIATFEDIRTKVLDKKILKLVDYGKAFKGLMTKAQAIILSNNTVEITGNIECKNKENSFFRTQKSFQNNPKKILNFGAHQHEAEVITQLYSVEHTTLSGKAKWALGIVTGNNQKFCKDTLTEGYAPILKGTDITKHGIKQPTTFIPLDFSNFQQVAPLEMYLAPEKIIYKFISYDLCFYCDNQQQYVLNSVNFFIPLEIKITNNQLTNLLNSEIINWLFNKLFATHKILRGDLELLPIHTSYFEQYSEFSEESYLQFLNLIKLPNRTFRVKN
ncbi:site-specific DNA-methyltransferase (adenine-specific) [Flexibacter flexilis DSM 6793]|uniref:site-specific DNA-methyltransferase (adenine-specific) n=1 Tax=Flexibacter flexilis DSM 6793 TaxID=927664 RepID=A0A1I1KNG5_9BACT|nr:TaqI-like C-terminal specificity domain-containing protein [Flexibacter flexilis]SFC60208.1 site-specific DNA-methyltransferase (adenine-specific) [Flexibacter flexilis DSM 6793]